MSIRALTIAAFVSVLILAGCAPPVSRSGTPAPVSTPVPIATWVSQGIPSDLVITYETVNCWADEKESIRIVADGSAMHTCCSCEFPKQFAGKLSPEALRRVILAFEEKRFFYLNRDEYGCISDIASPPFGSPGVATDASETSVSIRINGILKNQSRYDGCCYLYKSSDCSDNSGDANFSALIEILKDSVKGFPPVTSTKAGTVAPVSTATATGP